MMIILPTLDGDPGSNFPQRKGLANQLPSDTELDGFRSAVKELFSIFDTSRLKGKVTWFVNERDVQWTVHYPDLLGEITHRHDTLALHVHYDGLFTKPKLDDFNAALTACEEAKEKLERLSKKKCRWHRSGCFFQSQFIYDALNELKFSGVSDVYPGFKAFGAGGGWVDNSMVPVNAGPWRHSSTNWLDYQSSKGDFLHIPVSAGNLAGLHQLSNRIKTNDIKVACWDLHPHEFQNEDGSLNDDKLTTLKEELLRLDQLFTPVYMNFDEFGEIP